MKTGTRIQRPRSTGFTLIEILIVVVILGLLAAMVIVQFVGVRQDAEKAAFVSSAQGFVDAARRYYLDTGTYPNAAPGTLPPGFEYYITSQHWVAATPIGGKWDSQVNAFGVTSSLGVFYGGAAAPKDDAYMLEIDAAIDDGDLTTGRFRKVSNTRYFFTVAN